MKKLLVIGDIHTKYQKAERICEKYPDHKKIFVADYFDDFGDTPERNASTAFWLKNNLRDSSMVFLKGNHDEHYDPRVHCMCSGFTTQKHTAINEVMTVDDWDQLKYFHYENGWWFSHAGITPHWFGNPMSDEITQEDVQKKIDNAITMQRIGKSSNAIWASDSYRGGIDAVGGIVWCDWRKLGLIPNVKQVVGHTPLKRITRITDNVMKCENVNIDCSLETHLGEVVEIDENGVLTVINTSYV